MAALQSADTVRTELLSRVLAEEVMDMPWLDRSSARSVLREHGLPFPGKGRWQYSDLRALVEDAMTLDDAHEALGSVQNVEIRHLDRRASDAQMIELGSSDGVGELPLIDVNGLLFRSGTKLLADGNASRVAISDATGSVDRHLVSVVQDATLQLDERFESGNRVVLCRVRDSATLNYDLTMPSTDGVGYHCLVVWLAEGSTLNLHLASQGAQIRRSDIIVNVMGRNASATLSGGWLIENRDHLDTQVYVNHRIGQSRSEQSFHGVVDDQARSTFSGFIRIERDANETEAHLTNRNIALSPQARAHAQPELEIYTDDVICSHGATTGQLDDDSLFLLRARGIGEQSARAMLTKGFLRQVIHSESGTALLSL